MFTDKYRQIGLKIAYHRKLRSYTQEELSFKAGISTSYLSRIERGNCKKGVSLSVILTIAKTLSIDVGELVSDQDP